MKIRQSTYLCIGLWAAVLAGCVSLDIREANHELVNLYSAKAEATNSDDAAREVAANGALAVLAEQAAEKCGDRTLSAANRISFARIAATAAWQAGSDKVVDYAEAGQSLCDRDGNFSLAPRDCGMLLILPDLAAADELKVRYDAFNQRVGAAAPPSEEEVNKLYYDIAARVASLLNNRDTIKASAAHPRLLESLDRNTGTLFCRHLQDTLGLIVQTAGGESVSASRADCENYHLKVRLKQLDFSRKTAPCLPSGPPVVPEGCR